LTIFLRDHGVILGSFETALPPKTICRHSMQLAITALSGGQFVAGHAGSPRSNVDGRMERREASQQTRSQSSQPSAGPSRDAATMPATPIGSKEQKQRFDPMAALGRLDQPQDIADVVALVASEDAGWITTLDFQPYGTDFYPIPAVFRQSFNPRVLLLLLDAPWARRRESFLYPAVIFRQTFWRRRSVRDG
jgi:hypothetical protein